VLAQVGGITVDDVTMASVVAALGSHQQPVAIDRARIDRQIRELALEHAGGGLGDDVYLMRHKVLREQRDAIAERTAPGLPGHRAVEWLRAIGEAMQNADVAKEKSDLMHAIYERITVAGPEIVRVRLIQAAYAHGLALALPEKVEMARPTGVARSRTHFAFRLIRVVRAAEWVAAGRRSAENCGPSSAKQGRLRDDFDLHAERLVDRPRPRVPGDELPSVLPRGGTDEGVVDGTARDAHAGEVRAELGRLRLAEKGGRWEVVGEKADDIGR